MRRRSIGRFGIIFIGSIRLCGGGITRIGLGMRIVVGGEGMCGGHEGIDLIFYARIFYICLMINAINQLIHFPQQHTQKQTIIKL